MIALVKVVAVTGAAHMARLFTLLIILKLIAVHAGPEGLGFWGNYINLVSIAGSLAGGGILSGIIKYVAEFRTAPKRFESFVTSAFMYSLGFSLLIACVGFLGSASIAGFIFGSVNYVHWVYYFLFFQCIVAVNNLAYGILNGQKKSSQYALCIIIGNVIALLCAFLSIEKGSQGGIFFAIMAPIVCPIIPVLWTIIRSKWFLKFRFNHLKKDTKHLAKFSLMIAFSTVCFPVVEIIIRNQMIEVMSMDAAGYWQAITRISAALLSFFSLFLMVYFLPLVSAQTNKSMVLKSSYQCMVLLGSAMVVIMFLVWCFGKTIILALYTDQFLIIKPWLQMQLLGDSFRVMAWVIGFLIIARAKTSWYIFCELLQGGLFVTLASMQLYYRPSIIGVVDAYVITCLVYFMILFSVFVYWARYHSPNKIVSP